MSHHYEEDNKECFKNPTKEYEDWQSKDDIEINTIVEEPDRIIATGWVPGTWESRYKDKEYKIEPMSNGAVISTPQRVGRIEFDVGRAFSSTPKDDSFKKARDLAYEELQSLRTVVTKDRDVYRAKVLQRMKDSVTRGKKSVVEHPEHYNWLPVEAWDISKHLDHCSGSALDYIIRAGRKEGNSAIQDYQKAIEWLKKRIEFLEEQS